MKEKNRLYWTDLILPLVVLTIGVSYTLYVIFFPIDSMVRDFLTTELILRCLSQHLYLVAVSSLLAIVTAVPLGIILTRPMFRKFCNFVVAVVNVCQTVPGLAVIALFVGVLGIGSKTAIFALWIYSLLPILNNTIAGINGIDPAIIGYAAGMGMTKSHTLTRIEIPLAVPVIMAGIRTAVVINVATTVIAAYVGAGGLGDIIIAGKNINRWQVLVTGAGFSALIALLIDHILGVVERVLTN
jgi:osmoprotectant transport system permease protein